MESEGSTQEKTPEPERVLEAPDEQVSDASPSLDSRAQLRRRVEASLEKQIEQVLEETEDDDLEVFLLPKDPPKPRDPNWVPSKIGRSDALEVLRESKVGVIQCFEQHPPSQDLIGVKMRVRLVTRPGGTVKEVNVLPPYAKSPVGRCVTRLAKKLRFPKAMESTTMTYPYPQN